MKIIISGPEQFLNFLKYFKTEKEIVEYAKDIVVLFIDKEYNEIKIFDHNYFFSKFEGEKNIYAFFSLVAIYNTTNLLTIIQKYHDLFFEKIQNIFKVLDLKDDLVYKLAVFVYSGLENYSEHKMFILLRVLFDIYKDFSDEEIQILEDGKYIGINKFEVTNEFEKRLFEYLQEKTETYAKKYFDIYYDSITDLVFYILNKHRLKKVMEK